MSDDRALGLRELSDVDAPEVVSAALSRFRRRMFVRAVLVPALAVGVFFLSRALPSRSPTVQRQFAEARQGQALGVRLMTGAIDVVALEAKRVQDRDGDWVGLRVVVTTDALRGKERLSVGEPILGVSESCRPNEPSGRLPPAPVSIYAWGYGVTAPDVADVVLKCPIGTRGARIEVGAYYSVHDNYDPSSGSPPPVSEDKGPGTHTQEECAVPLNPLGVCAMTKAEGSYRALGTIDIDFPTIGVGREIWRDA